jgi:hypothetical protein
MQEKTAPSSRLPLMVKRHAWWVVTIAVYASIMAGTAPLMWADTIDYAGSIKHALQGRSREYWEFGHLFWRPLGHMTYSVVSPLIDRLTGSDPHARIVTVLIAWNWLGGLVGMLALSRFVSRLGVRPWCAPAMTLAYIVTFGVLNYSHSGSSYIPGLACLLVALALLVSRNSISAGTGVAAGVALACAVGFWAPYVLVIPAYVSFPLVWFGYERRRFRVVLLVTASFVLVLGSAYLLAIQRLGIRDVASLRSWVTESSHGIVNIGGFSRMAFGIARSFIFMGKDGILFKRFLLKDSFNPVTLSDLIRLSLANLTFIYVVFVATIAGLLHSKMGRRLLMLAILGGCPVLVFAVSWQGGDVERYVPTYPLVFAAWAVSLGGDRPIRLTQTLILSILLVMSVINLPALSRSAALRTRAQLEHRVEEIRPLLGPEDRVYVVAIQDRLIEANRDPMFPRTLCLNVRVVIPLGYASTPRWRNSFASDVQGVWDRAGRAWISKRLLSQRPKAEWDWVEGSEQGVRWSDLPAFFGAFEVDRSVGDEDGFAALAATPHNQQIVRNVLGLSSKADRVETSEAITASPVISPAPGIGSGSDP